MVLPDSERVADPQVCNIFHACMPGCIIQCSNVYVDTQGKEMTSPVEYETLALLGTNCGWCFK
jgi:aldehyde:ferredoxin oxidoreductase